MNERKYRSLDLAIVKSAFLESDLEWIDGDDHHFFSARRVLTRLGVLDRMDFEIARRRLREAVKLKPKRLETNLGNLFALLKEVKND